jgi:hypothetical protein
MAAARRAATLDLLDRIETLPWPDVTVVCSDPEVRPELLGRGHRVVEASSTPFHFGRELSRILDELDGELFAYFGGASAPLADAGLLGEALERLAALGASAAVVNNLHSTDWGLFRGTAEVRSLAERLPNDNALGWVLSHEAGWSVEALAPRAATRADVDTPADVLLLREHTSVGANLRRFQEQLPPELVARLNGIKLAMRTPGSTLTLIGRVSAHVSLEMERSTQIWLRVFAEERGMVASGRLAARMVRSLIGDIVEEWGPTEFLRRVAEVSSAVLWDCRVWLARHGWPSPAERYAADLGWTHAVPAGPLRSAVEAAQGCGRPVILGGHGVVGGGLLALIESTTEG